jgi:hypothetical protein
MCIPILDAVATGCFDVSAGYYLALQDKTFIKPQEVPDAKESSVGNCFSGNHDHVHLRRKWECSPCYDPFQLGRTGKSFSYKAVY